MSARQRGIIIFAVLLVVGIFVCGILPFVWMPSWGIGMALPIIEVPGEVVVEAGQPFSLPFGTPLTNTFIGTLFADAMLVIFVFLAWRASNGWRNEVPKRRLQALAEIIVETLYNFCKGIAGDRLRTAPFLWPLVATIFLFLLAGNMMKLFPGVETIGKMHCAHIDKNGYAMVAGSWTNNSYLLYVDEALDSGTTQTEAGEHACAEYFNGWKESYKAGFPAQTVAEIEETVEIYEGEIATLKAVDPSNLTPEAQEELKAKETYIELAEARIASLEAAELVDEEIVVLDEEIAALNAQITVLEGGESEAAAHGEEAAHSEETSSEAVTTEAIATEEAVATQEAVATEEAVVAAEPVEGAGEPAAAEVLTAAEQAEVLKAEVASLTVSRDELVSARNLSLAQVRFPGATLPLTEEQMAKGAVPYIFHITPFFRGPATDLSLTIALAIMSMVLVQIYGIYANHKNNGSGLIYFEKFINVTALGNLNKKPMGAIDFIVGIIEIISEIGKIVSLAFRLFGNLFAGGVALMAISFLVAMIVPTLIYGLEVIIGAVQALVFAVLTLVFSAQAMESHHGDDHGHDGHEAHADQH